MCYLDSPRLHFSGRFFADPSTINNTLENYELKPPLDLSWNPEGSAFFRIMEGRVGSVVGEDGTVLAPGASDPIIGASVSTVQAPQPLVAKIVDLDPDQQTITQLYGVVVVLTLPGGQGSVTGKMAVSELRDLWFGRVVNLGGDVGASGIWQSVLRDLQWSGLEHSAFLQALYKASPEALSIKFVNDAYDSNRSSPTFNQGRIAGTIGPFAAGEPIQVVMGRRLVPAPNQPYSPAPFKVARGGCRLLIDLGNSVPLRSPGGPVSGPSLLNAVILAPLGTVKIAVPIDVSEAAYMVNSGVCEVPLTPAQANLLTTSPLGMVAEGDDTTLLLSEPQDGRYVNLEPLSLRLEPGEVGKFTIYATQFGAPLGGLQLEIGFDQPGIDDENTPASGLQFPCSATTLSSGRVTVEVTAGLPRPLPARRTSIGSQVYFLGGEWETWGQSSLEAAVSILVFDSAPPIDHPTWADVQPVLNRYAALYPAMKRRLDLSDFAAVSKRSAEILDVLSLPFEDPGYMPVTRDLSASHRKLIQAWIEAGCPRGNADV
jgi:hypothetical protein